MFCTSSGRTQGRTTTSRMPDFGSGPSGATACYTPGGEPTGGVMTEGSPPYGRLRRALRGHRCRGRRASLLGCAPAPSAASQPSADRHQVPAVIRKSPLPSAAAPSCPQPCRGLCWDGKIFAKRCSGPRFSVRLARASHTSANFIQHHIGAFVLSHGDIAKAFFLVCPRRRIACSNHIWSGEGIVLEIG